MLLAAGAILFVRLGLGFQFPVPWPDETGFLAQAFDLASSGSLFDPGLNPDRVVMWMPPGYMVLLAGVFRIAGYSFALARWTSTLFCLGSLGIVGVLVWRLTDGWRRILLAWLTALAFVSPAMLVDSNVARMEMLLCCLVLLSLAAACAGRLYLAACVIAMAALVHFNAVYFAAPVVAGLCLQAASRQLTWPRRSDWLAIGAATLTLSAYGFLVAANWPGFQADMAFQFSAKAFFGHNDPAHPAWLVWAAVLAALPAILHPRGPAAMPALFGVAFLVMVHEGHEFWYDYGQPLGFLLILLALASVPPRVRGLLTLWSASTAGLLVFACLRVNPGLQPLLPHWGMLGRSVVAPTEITKVRRFIATLSPGETVNFGWSGMEPFFFADLARVGARWTIIRHSVTQVFPLRAADWRVRCDSSEWPSYLFQFDVDVPRAGRDTGCDIIASGKHS